MRAVCPECRGRFPWQVQLGYPKSCPLCGYSMGCDRADDDIVMPFVRSSSMKQTDQVYREMERTSEARAQNAADLAGVPVSEMSGLKITNINEARREGDIAAVPVSNDVTRFMEQTKIGGFQGGGVEYGAAVQTGPVPNAGAKMRTTLQQHHTNVTHGSAVSDRPALETMQPGYRRRG